MTASTQIMVFLFQTYGPRRYRRNDFRGQGCCRFCAGTVELVGKFMEDDVVAIVYVAGFSADVVPRKYDGAAVP